MITLALKNMASRSGLYRKSTEREWLRHLNFCVTRNQVIYIRFLNTIIGFATWYRTDRPKKQKMMTDGKYAVVPFVFIEPDCRFLVNWKRLLIREIHSNFALGKLHGVEYVMWKRGPENREDNRWRILRIKEGKIRRLKWQREVPRL